MQNLKLFVCSFVFLGLVVASSSGFAQEPEWYPRVFVRGEQREIIKSTPIELRPNRPLHFYGNTVRRSVYRGNPAPLPRDFLNTTAALIRRR